MDAKTKAFQTLKPVCVALGEAAKGLREDITKASTVSDLLEKLKRTLSSTTVKPGALHPQLAEYVFVPISQVLRISQKTTIQCLEGCLQCIAMLIDQGWRQHLPAQTAAQLEILFTLLAERRPQGLPFTESTEELQASAFWCLHYLFTVAGGNAETRRLLTEETHFPQLGKTISVMLDAIEDFERVHSQAAASSALEALLTHVADREIHASFLPGIISKITKAATPSTKGRTSPPVLVQCLTVVNLLLQSTLGEQKIAELQASGELMHGRRNAGSVIDETWQLNASKQLRPALASIMKLKSHSSAGVQASLGRLCLTLLRPCRKTLANCSTMALETLVLLAAAHRDGSVSIEFEMLLQADASITSLLQSLLYDWLQSLKTTMQSADEQAKVKRLGEISTAYSFLTQTGTDMTIIDRTAIKTLSDSVIVTVGSVKTQEQTTPTTPVQSLDLVVLGSDWKSTSFRSPLIKYKGQEAVLLGIEGFLKDVVSHGLPAEIWTMLARSLHQSEGETQIANFWLLLTAIETALEDQAESDALLNFAPEGADSSKEELEDLYSYALIVLTEQSDEPTDPRLSALALRTLALRARTEGQDFRFELVDALYPVLHTLATPDEMLQRDSITTLNILTTACGYASVKDLIVDNVDYLTNAVALKLNAFDVSPQAPQVLLMMLRMAGPTLLPYLEDTVESIFAALEDYHGYPLLVELLFKVLGVMAEEGVKAPQLTIEAMPTPARPDLAGDERSPITVEGLAMQLHLRAQDEDDAAQVETSKREQHPQRPWGDKPEPSQAEDADELPTTDEHQAVDNVVPGPPATRTYNLLLKITELTQHFLPSASPSLRTSLLALIRTTTPALAKHENSFLPLINTLWPEIASRLDDEESHMIATALDIVRVLCEYAGDFMRTRIIQLWPRLVEIYQDAAQQVANSGGVARQPAGSSRTSSAALILGDGRSKQALTGTQHASSYHADTSSKQLLSAIQVLVTVVMEDVRLPPEYIDEGLEMAVSMLGDRDLRAALKRDNGDAVWLARLRTGVIHLPSQPIVPEHRSWIFAEAAG